MGILYHVDIDFHCGDGEAGGDGVGIPLLYFTTIAK